MSNNKLKGYSLPIHHNINKLLQPKFETEFDLEMELPHPKEIPFAAYAVSPRISSNSTTKWINTYWYLELHWRQVSQSVENNTTLIEASVYWGVTGGGWNQGANKTGSITIDGQRGNINYNHALSSNQKKLLGTVRKTVSHNSNGSKRVTISASIPIQLTLNGVYVGTEGISLTDDLNSIPRNSSFQSLSGVTLPGGRGPGFTIKASVNTYRHNVDLKIDNVVVATMRNLLGGSHQFNLTDAQQTNILNRMSSSTSKKMTLVMGTYTSGGSRVGPYTNGTVYANVSTSVVPIINSVTLTEENEKLKKENLGILLDKMSRVRIQTKASGAYGSSIKSIEVLQKSAGVTKVTYRGSDIYTNVIEHSNSNLVFSFEVVVTDSRGRSTRKTINKDVQTYTKPVITYADCYRVDVDYSTGYFVWAKNDYGTFVRVVGDISVYPLGNKNQPWSYKIEIRQIDSSTWQELETKTYTDDDFDITIYPGKGMGNEPNNPNVTVDPIYSYIVKITVKDKIDETVSLIPLQSAFTIMDFHNSGKGMAVGKVSEKQYFEMAMKAEFLKEVVDKDGVEFIALGGKVVEYND